MHHFSYGESPPGVRLGELLRKPPASTHETLAKRLGVSTYRLRTLLKGTKAIDVEMALKLACIFPEHSARDWLDMQTAYDLHQTYASGKMIAVAREMGTDMRNMSMVDWQMENYKKSAVLRVSLRCPINHMVEALCEKLNLSPQDIALEAIQRFWKSVAQPEQE